MGDLVEGSPGGLRKGAAELEQISALISNVAKHLENAPRGSGEVYRLTAGSSTDAIELSSTIRDQSAELKSRANLFEQAGTAGNDGVRALNTKALSWIETGGLISFFAGVGSFLAARYEVFGNLGNAISTGIQTVWGKITKPLSPEIKISDVERIAIARREAEQEAKKQLEEARKIESEALLLKYDGKNFAEVTNTIKTDRYSAKPIISPPVNSTSADRHPNRYSAVINQFGVETNPRYEPRNNNTYCNIFAWDVTSAMGAEIPHWYDRETDTPINYNTYLKMDPELKSKIILVEKNANGTVDWMSKHSESIGWHPATAEQAQEYANQGRPAVAMWKNPRPRESGHVAMVRPGNHSTTNGPIIAQAGGTNLNFTNVREAFSEGWKNDSVVYYIHE